MGCAAALKIDTAFLLKERGIRKWVASRPSGSKLPSPQVVRPIVDSTFRQAKKNPPKRVFPKTIIDSLSAAILAMVDHP